MDIIGHRGSPCAETPENTLSSVLAALAAGADGVEVDVRLTADDVAVCCHDPGLQRVAGVSRGLRSLTLADLAAVRVQGHQVPTVGAVAAAVPRGRTLVLDLKPEHRPRRLLQAVAAALEELPDDAGTVVFSATDPSILDTCARLLPDAPRAVILQEGEPFSRVLAMALRRGDSAVHVPLRTVFASPELVQVARSHGLVVRVWTVNRAVDARLLKVLGVDAILTDVPATMRSALTPRLAPVD
jgi:glycerophosphoryl diester phosphodiesterase